MSATDQEFQLSAWRGEFVNPATERTYRARMAAASAADLRVALWIWIVLLLLFMALDYQLYEIQGSEWYLFEIRLLLLVGLLFLIWHSHRKPEVVTGGVYVSLLWILTFLSLITIYFVRPGVVVYTVIITILVLIAVFVMVPNRLVPALFSALFGVVGTLYTSYMLGGPIEYMLVITLALLTPTAIGYLAARKLHLSQRRQFAHLLQAEQSNRLLLEEIEHRKTLRLAKAEAEQANRAKSRFLAAASHDLRQPLQAISMLLGVLSGQTGEAERTQLINQTRTSLDTIDQLLNSLLDISKLESGTLRPHIQRFSFHEVLQRVFNSGAPHAAEKHIQFSYIPCDWEVESDAALLEQLCSNLVSNAIRYTPPGGHVVLGCRRRGMTLEIQVVDNGIGIPAAEIDNIFNEFVQLENQGQRSSMGMGLGLAIVKRIVELLGLRYEIRSEVGRGTGFSVYLPLLPDSGRKSAVVNVQPEPGVDPGKAIVVLLVEDDLAVLQSTAMFLEVSGLRVLAAKNLLNALQLINQTRPDLIISDYGLRNDENGIQVVAAVRNQLGKDVKALIVTGDTSAKRVSEAAESNCDIIYKPINPETLLDRIHELSKQKS